MVIRSNPGDAIMRRFLIDTDTASDDAVALIMALREPDIRVEAITVVAGNPPLPLAATLRQFSATCPGDNQRAGT
jgi:inosine-uridine nucleoside N-ribohydrolase